MIEKENEIFHRCDEVACDRLRSRVADDLERGNRSGAAFAADHIHFVMHDSVGGVETESGIF